MENNMKTLKHKKKAHWSCIGEAKNTKHDKEHKKSEHGIAGEEQQTKRVLHGKA